MSRTVRRKNCTHEYDWVLREYDLSKENGYWVYLIDRKTPEGIKRLARYHSDAERTRQMVPSGFRAVVNGQSKAKNKAALRFLKQNMDRTDEILFPKDIRTVVWMYN